MRHAKQLAAFLTIIIALFLFAGTAFAASKQTGETLTVCVPVDRCPLFYMDDADEIVGIGVDLMTAAAKDAGYKVNFVKMQEPTLKDALDNSEYDLIMPFGSAISSTAGQTSIVSENLIQTPFTLVTVNNKELPDLNKLKVGMLKSQAGVAETIKQLYPGIEITLNEDMAASIAALKAGKVDALLHNSYVWSYVLQRPAYSNLTMQPASMISMDFRAGTLDTPKGHEIIDRLNEGIAKMPATRKQAIVLDYTTRKLYKYDCMDYIYEYGLIVAVFIVVLVIICIEIQKLKKAEKVAADASKAKSMFLANMSHEIKTPINTIMGMGEMISRETDDPKIKQYTYSISRSASSLMALINDILDFSRMEAGKLKLRNDPYHLSSLLTDVNVMIKGRAESKDLDYRVEIDEDIPDELVGDETRLKQVIINLLTNGVKYTAKGFVLLKIDYEKDDEDTVDLKIMVEDTGIGMKKNEIEKLFNAFERFDEAHNRTIEGTGLGMSIVKQILDAMESTLNIESVYGSGSTFSFTVRQKVEKWDRIGNYNETAKIVVSKQSNYRTSFIAPKAKILICDDTEINITVIKGLLEPTQMQIDSAQSGKQAIKFLENTKYDILLLDYRMPEMDGLELLKHIKSDLDNLNYYSVCIVLTANNIEGAREMYLKAGFDEYLEKPVKGRQLEEMLLRFLPKDKVTMCADSDKDTKPQKISKQTEDAQVENVTAENTSSENTSAGDVTLENASVDEHSQKLQKLQDEGLIDVETGIEYAGSEELFVETLRFFRDGIDKKCDEIQELYFNENLEDYTVKVHALKSSARLIGAKELSEEARKLEEAGKQGDLDYIKENTAEVLQMYDKYKKILTGL